MASLNRTTRTFIFQQNDTILTNLFNAIGDSSEKAFTLEKNPEEFEAGKKIIKIIKKDKTAEEKNALIAPILKMIGVPEEDIPNRIYDPNYICNW